VTSRRERSAKLKAAQKSRMIIVAAGVATIIILLLLVSIFSHKRDTTDIEKVIPQSAGVVFLSDANQSSWDYFNALAGSNQPFPEKAKEIGFASIGTSPTVYLSINNEDKEETEQFLKDNTIPFINKDNVYALTTEESRISGDSVAGNSEYKKYANNGTNSSFGYINFTSLNYKGMPDEMKHILPTAGIWTGEFKANKWQGKITNVNFSQIDESKASDVIYANPLVRSFTDEIEYAKGENSTKGSFSVSELNSLLDTKYQSSIRTIDFEIKGDQLSFTLGQE
jgi:hypothetical protein